MIKELRAWAVITEHGEYRRICFTELGAENACESTKDKVIPVRIVPVKEGEGEKKV